MKSIFIVLALTFSVLINAQTKNTEEVLKTFQIHYNNYDVQEIYDLMDSKMKSLLTEDRIDEMLSNFTTFLGKLKSYEFTKTSNGFDIYKSTFEKGEQDISLVVNAEGNISGIRFKPTVDVTSKKERNKTILQLPFKDEWFTFWGGDSPQQNYHVSTPAQRGAFDFIILGEKNKSYKNNGTTNDDYFAFNQPIFATCDAEVVTVITGVEDNKPTVMNSKQVTGNTVILKTKNNEYIVYAHFKKGTILVKEGDQVSLGQHLGNCGNSGNSSEPHLHIHIQDGPNMLNSLGLKCYFKNIQVNGELKTDYSPVKLDRISLPNN